MQWLLGTCCRRHERSGGRYGRLSTDDDGKDEGGQAEVCRWRAVFLVALGLGAGVWVLGMMQALAVAAAALVGTLVWHRRRVHVFWVAYGIRSDFKATRAAARALSNPSTAELQTLWGGVHERSAERMLATVNSLQGLWIKTAQLLATRADIMADAYIHRFKTTQDSMPPRPFAEVQSVIASELRQLASDSASPRAQSADDSVVVSEVFEWVGRDPIASASIAQVHRARLRDTHKEVVVKVQHDGVDALMLHDLETVRLLTIAIVKLEPDLDFRPLLDAWCAEVPKELDFRIEAQNMAEVSANLSAAGGCGAADGGGAGDPALEVDVLLPRVVPELTSRRLLVMSYEEGARLTEPPSVTRTGVDVGEFIRAVARAYAQQMFIDGVYNADPHPGNFLVSTAPHSRHKPVLLDFGLCTRLVPSLRCALAKLVVGVSSLGPGGPEQNAEARATLFEAFSEMGWPLGEGDEATATVVELAVFLFRETERLEDVKRERDAAEAERLQKVARTTEAEHAGAAAGGGEQRKLLSPLKALPGELIFFQRVLQLLRGLAVEYSVQLNFMEVWAPFARRALGLPPAGAAAPSAGGAAGAEPEGDEQAVPGTEWLMGFDEDGDVYYKHRASGQVVWSQPDEVAAAEQAAK